MSRGRALLRYDAPGVVAAPAIGFDPDRPVAGFYRMRLVRGGMDVGIRIWFGRPLDPVTHEKLDRSPRWQATANKLPIDLERVWPRCAESGVDQAEYDFLVGRQTWAQRNAPESPQADPTRPVDLLTAPLPF